MGYTSQGVERPLLGVGGHCQSAADGRRHGHTGRG